MTKKPEKYSTNKIKISYLSILKSSSMLAIILLVLVLIFSNSLIFPASAKVNSTILNRNNNITNDFVSKNFSNLFPIIKKESKDGKFSYQKIIAKITNKHERIDSGSTFYNQIIDYNNRLDYYDLYIKLAKSRGYIVTSYIDYLNNYMHTDKKVLILRHDIDVSSVATKLMLDIEKKNNVKATYYFRWATFDKALIDEVVKQGGEVGLHYETIANYCIRNRQNYVSQQDIIKCRDILKKEIKDFKTRSGVDIKTISSHGNPINKAIGVPNYVILKGQKYSDYGVVSETYDKNILKNYIKSYICDNEVTFNTGYSYQTNPIDSIEKNMKVIEFLSHPHHWYSNIFRSAGLYLEVKAGIIKL